MAPAPHSWLPDLVLSELKARLSLVCGECTGGNNPGACRAASGASSVTLNDDGRSRLGNSILGPTSTPGVKLWLCAHLERRGYLLVPRYYRDSLAGLSARAARAASAASCVTLEGVSRDRTLHGRSAPRRLLWPLLGCSIHAGSTYCGLLEQQPTGPRSG